MKMCIISLLLFLGLLVLMRSAQAGTISIETKTAIETLDNHAQAIVMATNNGDEPACNLKVSIEIGEQQLSGRLKNSLAPHEQYRQEFNVGLAFSKPGRYPVIVNTEYTDANLYPFTAPMVTYLNYKDSVNARVAGTMPQVTLSKTGSIDLTVNNLDSAKREFRVRLVSPKEIMITNAFGRVAVDPGSGKTLSFLARNISAVPGSTYPVFALIGYEDDRYSYSTIVTGTIVVSKGGSTLRNYRWPLIATVLVLIAIVVTYNVRNAGKSGTRT